MSNREEWSVSYDADADKGTIAYVPDGKVGIDLQFQHGPIQDNGVNGIQNEELIDLLLLRLRALNARFPCRENSLAITNLEQTGMWLRERTRLRVTQGVEGQNIAHVS